MNLFILIVLIIVSLALMGVSFLYFKTRKTQKTTINLFEEESDELKFTLNKVDEKNSDFKASINYAKRLVDTIFKIGSLVSFNKLDYFLFYKPKEIISGDFVWHKTIYDRHYFVVADCTGHGVPGAFMSIISYNLFSQAVNEFGYTKPSEILEFVNKKHFEIFNTEQDDRIKDGMDVGICVVDTDSEIIEFAGAMRPLYILRADGTLEKINGDRMSIGEDGYQRPEKFKDHFLDFSKGDSIYLTTDGFVDQFGGPNGKKYKTVQFQQLISGFASKEMHEQCHIIAEELKKWQGKLDQIDDITILGVKALV